VRACARSRAGVRCIGRRCVTGWSRASSGSGAGRTIGGGSGCAHCGAVGVPLQRDCVLARSRGGRYTLGNVAPACASCNASKRNDEVSGWLRRKRLDERAFLLRHHEIQSTSRSGSQRTVRAAQGRGTVQAGSSMGAPAQ
jgi:hypothetical protein